MIRLSGAYSTACAKPTRLSSGCPHCRNGQTVLHGRVLDGRSQDLLRLQQRNERKDARRLLQRQLPGLLHQSQRHVQVDVGGQRHALILAQDHRYVDERRFEGIERAGRQSDVDVEVRSWARVLGEVAGADSDAPVAVAIDDAEDLVAVDGLQRFGFFAAQFAAGRPHFALAARWSLPKKRVIR